MDKFIASKPFQQCARSDMESKNASFGLKCTKMLLVSLYMRMRIRFKSTITTVNPTIYILEEYCLFVARNNKNCYNVAAQMGAMRDAFVCQIILQFYCENCMQNWFYIDIHTQCICTETIQKSTSIVSHKRRQK